MIIRRTLIFLCAILCANVLLAQDFYDDNGVGYTINGSNTVAVTGVDVNTLLADVEIPSIVENDATSIAYTVTSIGDYAFSYRSINSVIIPNTVTSIGNYAFQNTPLVLITFEENSNLLTIGENAFYNCYNLQSITIPNTVTSIGSSGFQKCSKLQSITIPSSVDNLRSYTFADCSVLSTVTFGDDSELTTIGSSAFSSCTSLTSIIIPKKVSSIKGNAFYKCTSLVSVEILAENPPDLSDSYYVFSYTPGSNYTPGTKELTVPFGSDYSAWENYTTWGRVIYKTNVGETKTLNYTFLMTTANKREVSNEGVIKIEQGGEIVNATDDNVGGTIEIVSQSANQYNWNFFGVPFSEDYRFEVIKPHESSDVAVCKYDYDSGAWSRNWATIDTIMQKGEGAFAYHFYTGSMVFTSKIEGVNYKLNNGDVTVTHSIISTSNGNWMALANPYPAKLSVSTFVSAHGDGNNSINNDENQGRGVYVWSGTDFEFKTSGEINVAQGFFVNFTNSGSRTATFTKTQLTNYPTTAKSEVAPREFIELALEKGDESVKVYFAQNEEAEQEYDIYDANKMFATMGAAEPYFVTDGIALIKEEVKTLPYYATMNVRSEDDTVMNFVMKNLPDGYAVSIIDGDNVIDMAEGSIYTTQISVGDNENRFKLLVKKNVGLADVEELDVRITNSNRHVSLQTAETNLNIEVYNTLGQKVFTTKEHNFILKGVSAGAYMIKAYNNKASKTTKIVVQ